MPLLYIHQLNHLTPKNAELESVYLVRELKQKLRYPLEEVKVRASLDSFRIQASDLQVMQEGLKAIQPTAEKITHLLLQRDAVHEPINVQRAIKQVKELEAPLQNNINYQHSGLSPRHNVVGGITAAAQRLESHEDFPDI